MVRISDHRTSSRLQPPRLWLAVEFDYKLSVSMLGIEIYLFIYPESVVPF